MRQVLLLFCFILLPDGVLAQQVLWRSGPLMYTPAYDFTLGYMPNGTGYYVSQAYIASPPQPEVNQVFYVSVVMNGIASPAAGRLMAFHFIPPAGTSIVANAATPVRCFYRAMDGSSTQYEFTNTAVTDVSFGASLRIFGCPQPAASGNPYSIVTLPNGNGNAYFLDRRDPQRPGQTTWPLGSQAGYEFLIPLVSAITMDGFSAAYRAYAPIQSIQGDGLDPWTYPYLALQVSPASATPVADLQAGPPTTPAPPPPGRVGTQVRCYNAGPNVAQNVSCGFNNLPAELHPTISCQPSSPQASLAVGSAMLCGVSLDRFIGFRTIQGFAATTSVDSNLGNNAHNVNLFGGLTVQVFGSGFE
jgi:hypothetical protein